MTKEELKEYLSIDNKSGYKTKENHIKSNFPDLYEIIIGFIKDIPFKEKLYLFINGFEEIPKCPTCGNNNKYSGKINKGYSHHCSIKCSNNDPNVVKKIKDGNIITQNK